MEIFIIPLIALAVYILQYVFKGPEDNKQQGQRRPGAPRTNPGKPRRQVSDLDRFLEETRKRKQQEEGKPVVVAEVLPERPPADRGEAVERERKAASRPRPQGQRSTPRGERKPSRPQPPAPPPETPRRPLRETAAPVLLELAPAPEPRRPSVPSPVPAVPPPVPVAVPAPPVLDRFGKPDTAAALSPSQRQKTPPVLTELVQLLRRPQGIALAVVLHEILDTPAHRRRG